MQVCVVLPQMTPRTPKRNYYFGGLANVKQTPCRPSLAGGLMTGLLLNIYEIIGPKPHLLLLSVCFSFFSTFFQHENHLHSDSPHHLYLFIFLLVILET